MVWHLFQILAWEMGLLCPLEFGMYHIIQKFALLTLQPSNNMLWDIFLRCAYMSHMSWYGTHPSQMEIINLGWQIVCLGLSWDFIFQNSHFMGMPFDHHICNSIPMYFTFLYRPVLSLFTAPLPRGFGGVLWRHVGSGTRCCSWGGSGHHVKGGKVWLGGIWRS